MRTVRGRPPRAIALFLTHWDAVNTELGASGPLVLPSGVTQAQLSTMRDDLTAFLASVEGKINDQEIARGSINLHRGTLHERLNEFNRKVRGFLGQTPFANALPDVPNIQAGEGRFLGPMNDCANLWTKINAATIAGFTPPLLLVDDYAIADFDADLAALKTAYADYADAEQSLKIERRKRNEVQDKAYDAMRDYRAAVKGTFAPENALVQSLPVLSGTPGSTPDAVTLSGSWDDVAITAELSWTESTDPNLDRYELRYSPGPVYSSEDEVLADNQPGVGMLTVQTTQGLETEGDIASFKVYVVLTTGNEKGSNAVAIENTTP